MGEILNFDRGADFHFSRAHKARDTGKYIESVAELRMSVEKEPDNTEYRYCLAELLSEMDLYEESNFQMFLIEQ